MIHIWTIEEDELILNIKELLKYDILAEVYRNDTSAQKIFSKEYFKYIDFIVSSSGYCIINGLSEKDAHDYALSQVNIPKGYELPKNNKSIVYFVKKNIEYDVVMTSIKISTKALNIINKNLEAYIDTFNEIEQSDYKDKDGNLIDISDIANKCLKITSSIPDYVDKLRKLTEQAKGKAKVIRGGRQFSQSYNGDEHLERFMVEDDEDETGI